MSLLLYDGESVLSVCIHDMSFCYVDLYHEFCHISMDLFAERYLSTTKQCGIGLSVDTEHSSCHP